MSSTAMALTVALSMGLGCGSASLDESATTLPATPTSDEGGSLGDGEGEDTTAGRDPGDPATGCAEQCRLTLDVDWAFDSSFPAQLDDPTQHSIPAFFRGADGSFYIAEQRLDWSSLYRLDADGTLAWHRPTPLPCDRCDLGGVSEHPSGDILLGAVGDAIDGEFSLIAGRWDLKHNDLRWASSLPLAPPAESDQVVVRSGDVVALTDALTVQMYGYRDIDFATFQGTALIIYGEEGTLLDSITLSVDAAGPLRRSFMLRETPPGELALAYVQTEPEPFTILGRTEPPQWSRGGRLLTRELVDDFVVDERGHQVELAHSFDGDSIRLVLSDRRGLESLAEWVAVAAVPSTTDPQASLGRSGDGGWYAALRTTAPIADRSDATVTSLTVLRWSALGELRWRRSIPMNLGPGRRTVHMLVDDDEGLIFATIVDGRVRVERREQRCECG